jgi:hypothetical protein
MKRAVFAAATALVGGLGAAGLMAAAPASAACEDTTPPLTPQRVTCVAGEQTNEFLRTTSPAYNLDVLLNGTVDEDGVNSGLGLRDQPQTFVDSIVGPGGFLDGPRSPDPAPKSANEP